MFNEIFRSFLLSNNYDLNITCIDCNKEWWDADFKLKEERIKVTAHDMPYSSLLVCEEVEFKNPCIHINPSFDSSNHEESLDLNVKFDPIGDFFNVFTNTSSDDFVSSSIDLSKTSAFHDSSFDSLETYQEIKVLQFVLMVMSRSRDLGKCSKHDKINVL